MPALDAATMDAARVVFLALAGLFALAAAIGMLYTIAASVLARRFFARPVKRPASFPPVTIIKPLHGDEHALLDNLGSFCCQDYPGAVQLLFGVHDEQDGAMKTVDALRRRYPDADITIVANARLHGPNRKISNILNMLPQARHDILIFADSDVGAGPDYLRNIVGELQAPGVGLVTCVYHGKPDPGFWPRFSAAAINYQFVPAVMTGLALRLAQPCFGPTIAMRRETLGRIGGLGQFAHHLAEDYAIGMAVRAIGEYVAIPSFAISHACVETSLHSVIAHELRRCRTIRGIDPAGYLGSVITHPFPLALLAVCLSGGSMWSWALAMAAWMTRAVLEWTVDRALKRARRDLWLLPFSDVLLFIVYLASFFSSCVVWRGLRFRVDAEGRLSAFPDE
jgi:ceramide glucosyltransferase